MAVLKRADVVCLVFAWRWADTLSLVWKPALPSCEPLREVNNGRKENLSTFGAHHYFWSCSWVSCRKESHQDNSIFLGPMKPLIDERGPIKSFSVLHCPCCETRHHNRLGLRGAKYFGAATTIPEHSHQIVTGGFQHLCSVGPVMFLNQPSLCVGFAFCTWTTLVLWAGENCSKGWKNEVAILVSCKHALKIGHFLFYSSEGFGTFSLHLYYKTE